MNSDKQLPTKKRRRRHSRPQQKIYRGITAEVSLKLVLSWIIAIAAVASLVELLPYHLSQKAKLKELRTQVKETNARVEKLRTQLNHNFDPHKARSLMEQYSSLLAPDRTRLYWLPSESAKPQQ